jgi:hypothetical protein
MSANIFMKKMPLLVILFGLFNLVHSQNKNFESSYYGFIEGSLFYNTRSNIEAVDGLFYIYPKDILTDHNGKDLNATPNSSFYSFTTRLILNLKGPKLGNASTSAKIESDFGGTTDISFMLRLRQAYIRLDWDKGSSLILGQTWHPLFGDVMPSIVNPSAGAPFQPFNRSPQINYQLRKGNLKLTTSAIYQLMNTSIGPNGSSETYQKNGVIPELYAGIEYLSGSFLAGLGAEMISLKPRTSSVFNNNTYKVDERITSFSYELHTKYSYDKWHFAGKSVLASNLTHMVMLGGFGVTETDNITGEQRYTPYRHSTSWINVTYGKKVQGVLLGGYSKNLGTSKELISKDKIYGRGLDIDQLMTIYFTLKYNLPAVVFALEYTYSTAWYGDTNLKNGKVENTHDVSNHHLQGVMRYNF